MWPVLGMTVWLGGIAANGARDDYTTDGRGVHPGSDVDLETFVEGNYLARDRDAAAELPTVKWWKSE